MEPGLCGGLKQPVVVYFFFIKESLIRETVLNHSLIFKFLENLGKFKKDEKAANNLDKNISFLGIKVYDPEITILAVD